MGKNDDGIAIDCSHLRDAVDEEKENGDMPVCDPEVHEKSSPKGKKVSPRDKVRAFLFSLRSPRSNETGDAPPADGGDGAVSMEDIRRWSEEIVEVGDFLEDWSDEAVELILAEMESGADGTRSKGSPTNKVRAFLLFLRGLRSKSIGKTALAEDRDGMLSTEDIRKWTQDLVEVRGYLKDRNEEAVEVILAEMEAGVVRKKIEG